MPLLKAENLGRMENLITFIGLLIIYQVVTNSKKK